MSRGVGSYIRSGDKKWICSFDHCMFCKTKNNLAIDHIIPLNKGGDSRRSNLTRICGRCNSFKSDFLIDEFYFRMLSRRDDFFNKVYYAIHCIKKFEKRDNLEMEIKFWNKFDEWRRQYRYFQNIVVSLRNKDYIL